MDLVCKPHWIAVLAATAAVTIGPPGMQSGATLIDLHGLSPREVKTDAFSLTSPQDVWIEATGAEPAPYKNSLAWARTLLKGKERQNPWPGNAWILDLTTRKVVWELSKASTTSGPRSSRIFSGTVRLPEGSYAAYYSAFPDGEYWNHGEGKPGSSRKWHWFGDEPIEDFKLVLRGNGQRLEAAEVARRRQAAAAGAAVALRAGSGELFQQAGFSLSKPTELEIRAAGEAREDGEFDFGWIINADTHAKVWKLTWHDSEAAGGAEKNRVAALTRTLPAGRYAAFYATDDTHDPSEWNAPPPHDPDAWGLTISVKEQTARETVKTFAYEHVPESATILALTRIGNGESRKRGFTLTRPMEVRIYALGEGREGQMFDYGWITSADSRKRVWEMRYASTEGAGGDPKNRLVDTTIRLDKGSYVVHYISDGSHSTGEWNASAPPDGRRWGITVLAAQGTLDRGAVAPFDERDDPSVLAQLTEVRDEGQAQKRFSLDRDSEVRIYALGEGSSGGMHDYGWIEDTKTGRRVWEMTYRATEHAGGATKNRRFDGTVRLAAGHYVLRYETDDSHAFGDWNAAPPDDPEAWGITVFRAGGR
jgi:hypothetical protein